MKKYKSGIYCILNIKNNKKYIGSSIRISTRWYEHKFNLRNNTHFNTHLQAAWNKYGEETFKFFIIEEYQATDKKGLCALEDKYMLEFDTINPEKGYNVDLAGNKIKISEETNRTYKSIIVLTLDGKFYKEYISIAEVERDLEIPAKKIDMVLNKRICIGSNLKKSVKGFQFIYKEEYDPTKDYTYKQERNHAIVCTKEDFTKEYNSPQEAADELGIKVGRIYEVLRGYANTCGGGYKNGYTFRYKEEFMKKFK